MTTLQRLFTFSAAGGRELRLKLAPLLVLSRIRTPKTYHITEPKHEPETAHPLRVPRCLLSVSQRGLTSIEVGHGGVWAMCPPQLLFFSG